MSNQFAPLTTKRPPDGALQGAFRLKILPQAAAKQAFTPLRVSSPPPTAVEPPPPALPVEAAQPTPCTNPDPIVSLQKDGDRISHIHIKCTCGQVIELNCVY